MTTTIRERLSEIASWPHGWCNGDGVCVDSLSLLEARAVLEALEFAKRPRIALDLDGFIHAEISYPDCEVGLYFHGNGMVDCQCVKISPFGHEDEIFEITDISGVKAFITR